MSIRTGYGTCRPDIVRVRWIKRWRASGTETCFWGAACFLFWLRGILALLVSTERARALAQMQTEFVLGVSHEFRTPLTVIRLAADNLTNGMVENSQQARTYGEIIGTHVSELSNMVEETLAFARVESQVVL